MKTYNQCKLQKENTHTTCYIPTQFAEVGKTLRIKQNDEWTPGWVVMTVGRPMDGRLIEDKAHNPDDIWKPSTKLTNRGNK